MVPNTQRMLNEYYIFTVAILAILNPPKMSHGIF